MSTHPDDLVPSAQAAVDRLERVAYSPEETARKLGCTRQHVYNLIANGTIQSFKLGRARRVSQAEIERLAGIGGDA